MRNPLGGRRPSAPLVLSTIALFVSLGGAGYAASGGNFVLGQPNTATTPTSLSALVPGSRALRVVNNDPAPDSTALTLGVADGHAPFTVDSDTKVINLNADKLDNLSSAAFLRKGQPVSAAVNTASGVLDVTNTGSTNGVSGKTESAVASGVYGEHVGSGGFGVAGRAGDLGNAIYGDNTGTGYAGYFEDKVHVGGNLEVGGTLDCTDCLDGGDVVGSVASASSSEDSERLDGIDASGYVRGGGFADGQAIAEAPGANNFLGPATGGLMRLSYVCPASLGNPGVLTIHNASGGVANVFVDSGGANPDYVQLSAGGFITYPAAAGGESFSIQAQGGPGVETIQAATVHRNASNDCHAQALLMVTP